ncbi:MAG: tetratricopeptide repeat protein [Anaerolineae bacterium]
MPDILDKLRGQKSKLEPLPEDSDLEQFFTDAEYARQAFEDLISADPMPSRLLIIHGVGGVGKSTLLKMYRLSCYRRRIPVALVGVEDALSSVALLAAWADDLSRMGVKLRTFSKTLDYYRALQAKVEEEAKKAKEAMRGAAEKVVKAAAKTAVEMTAIAIPGVGPFAAALGGAGTEAAIDWLCGFLSKPDIDLYLDPSTRLTTDFLEDLADAAARQRIVLMVDTYEQIRALDDWMRELAYSLPDNLLLVIAGRSIPSWDRKWPSWMGRAKIVEIEALNDEDLAVLVTKYCARFQIGEPNVQQVEAIAQFARGLPLAATTVVRLWAEHHMEDFHAVKPKVVADLAGRLLEGVPQEMRPAFEAASILRYFDVDSLGALLDGEGADPLYIELRRWPFVHPRREGLSVHDTMREMINEALSMRTPGGFRALHARAASYYGAQLMESVGEERERLSRELLYHTLRANESEGVDLLEELFWEAERKGQQELEQTLLSEASQYGPKQPQHRHCLQYLEARMGKDWPARERLYRQLLNEDLDETMRPTVLRSLAESLSFQGKPSEARGCLEEAIEICQRLGDPIETAWTRLELCWRIHNLDEAGDHIIRALEAFREAEDEHGMAVAELELGYNYLNRWQAAKARDAFTRSMELHRRLGNRRSAAMAQERVGQAYLIEGDFRQAIVQKKEALKVFEDLHDEWGIAWTLDELATCYSWTGQWELALISLERAQRIFAEWGDHRETACAVRQVEIYRKQGRFEPAMKAYQRALNTMPRHNAWTRQEIYAGKGHIHLARDEFKEALADYQRAIAEFRNRGMELEARMVGDLYLGKLYSAQSRWADAVEHYAISLESARSAGNHVHECRALVGICQAYYEQGDISQLHELIGQAAELGNIYGYYELLADIHILQGRMALDRAPMDQEYLDSAVGFYGAALKDALLYNRYKLDETLQEIIAHCREPGDTGSQVLAALRDFWRIDASDEGVPLPEAERIAREREPGDGSAQMTVVEKIEQALKECDS